MIQTFIVSLILIKIINCQVYQTFIDQPLNSYTDCPSSSWDFSSGAYDCWFECHWDASSQAATNDYGILVWDDSRIAQMQIDGMPNKEPTLPAPITDVMGAYELRITISLLRLENASGSPLWAGSDNVDVQIDGVSATQQTIQTYDTWYACYDTSSWADSIYITYQTDIVFLFDMSLLGLNQRNILDISVVPNLTGTPTYYGISKFKLEYLPCDIACLECNGSQPTDCETCPQDQVLQGNYCQNPPCNDKFYEDADRICWPCQTANCLHCDAATPEICTECDTTYIIHLDGTCLTDPCPDGQWEDGPIRKCELCDPSCVTCSGGTANDCDSCISTQYVPPVGPNGPPPGTCVNCWDEIPGCLLCNTTPDAGCTSCDEGWFLDAADCVATCVTADTWPNVGTNTCEPCHVGCVGCIDSSLVKCTSCTGIYYLSSTNPNVCSKYCPDGQYRDTSDNNCYNCTGCTTCEANATDCSTCPGGYIQGVTPNRTCVNCGANCTECIQEGCQRCNGGYLLLSDTLTCVLTTCPNGYYPDSGGLICVVCDPSCSQCTGPLTTGCTNGFCIAADGWYYDTINSECARCDHKCEQCTGGLDTECTICSLGYFIDIETGTTCSITCPQYQWTDSDNRSCALCVAPCLECFGGTSTSCLSCSPGKYLDGTGCTDCSGLCKTCQGQPDHCTSCGVSTFLKDNRCITDCGEGYYSEQTLRQCILCHSTCKNCNGLLQSNCIECDQPRFLVGNFCQTCSDYPGRYENENGTTNSLDDCLEVCGDGIRSTDQYECDDGNIKDGDGCDKQCNLEPGFRCIRQDIASEDVCYPLQVSFTISFEKNRKVFLNENENANINVIINFDAILVFPEGKTISDYVNIEIEGLPPLQYTVIQDLDNPFELVLSVQIPQSIIDKELTVSFEQDDEFLTQLQNRHDGNSEATLQIEYYAHYKESERTQSTIFSTLVQVLVTMQMMFFIVFVFGNAYPQIQLTIDILQILYLLRWSGIKYPLNGLNTFEKLEPFFNWYLPRVFSYIVHDYKNQNAYTNEYSDDGIDALFWVNADQVVFASCIGVFFYLLLKFFCSEIICKIRKQNARKVQKFLQKYLLYFFEYNFFINITQTAAIPIIFYGALQCTNINSQGVVIASVIMMAFCGLWILGLLCSWIIISIQNRKSLIYDDTSKNIEFRKAQDYFKIRILWSYIEVFSNSSFLQPVFMYTRKILFPILVVNTHNSNTIQLGVMVGFNFIYFLYLIISNPIRKFKKQNWKVFIQEFLHIGCYIPLFLITDDTDDDTSSKFQLFNIFIYILITFLIFSVSYLSIVYVIQPILIKLCQKDDQYKVAAIETKRPEPKIEYEEMGMAQIDNGSSDENLSQQIKDDQLLNQEKPGGFEFAPKKILRNRHTQNQLGTNNTKSTNNNLMITSDNKSK